YPVLEALRAWCNELAPTDLAARVRELTARSPWDVTRDDRRQGNTPMADSYTPLAGEVLRQPEVMGQLTDWFTSNGPTSGPHFGQALGLAEMQDAIAPTVASWIEGGLCRGLVAGYLRGVAARMAGLPDNWSGRLQQTAERHAEYAAALTLEADFSRGG